MSLFYTNETNTLKNHKEKVGDIMTSLKTANRRVGSFFAVAALVLATITPGLVPAFASAAQVTERSVALSSSSKQANDVTYSVTFKPVASAGAYAIEFCSNSPLINTACTAPAGLDVTSPSTATSGFTVAQTTASAAASDHNALAVTGTLTAGVSSTVAIAGIDNPDAAGAVYARIVTYANDTAALAYGSTTLGSAIDQGAAAFSITDTVGVSGAVLETMTFCVSGAAIDPNCVDADDTPPTVKLGTQVGDSTVLSATELSTGSIYSQISTNAASGAVVNLKSNATGCGGLLRAGAPSECDIAPADGTVADADFDGQALFGIKVTGATSDANGAFGIVAASGYTASAFLLNFDSAATPTTGVTSPYGDPVLDTAGAPANNKNAQITFGASVANNTPAGLYSADFSLIATGKF